MLRPGVDIEIGADRDDGRDVVEPLRNQHGEHTSTAVAD
jgi:hypothetical protein